MSIQKQISMELSKVLEEDHSSSRRSKLDPFEDAIRYLREVKKWKLKSILEWLDNKFSVKVTQPTLTSYMKNRKKKWSKNPLNVEALLNTKSISPTELKKEPNQILEENVENKSVQNDSQSEDFGIKPSQIGNPKLEEKPVQEDRSPPPKKGSLKEKIAEAKKRKKVEDELKKLEDSKNFIIDTSKPAERI